MGSRLPCRVAVVESFSSGTLSHTSTRSHGGRSRLHLSLREGSEHGEETRERVEAVNASALVLKCIMPPSPSMVHPSAANSAAATTHWPIGAAPRTRPTHWRECEAACVLVSEEPRWPLSLCSKRKHNDLEAAAN